MSASNLSERPAEPLGSADDVSILESYAPGLGAVAKAPLYQNSAIGGSRLFGEAQLQLAGDELRVTARRMRHGTAFFVLLGIIVGAFAPVGVLLYGLALVNARTSGTPADEGYLETTMYATLAIAAAAVVLYVIGRLLSAGVQPETMGVPLDRVSGRKAGRVFVLRGPVGRKGNRRKLVLKPEGKADRVRLLQLLEKLRG